MLQLVAIQLQSTPDLAANLASVEQELQRWHSSEQRKSSADMPTLVVLPECFACFSGIDGEALAACETLGDFTAPIQAYLVKLAQRYRIWIAAGTMATYSTDPQRYYASLPVISPAGNLVADYQKIHLFDVDVQDKTAQYRESAYTLAGKRIVVFDLEGIKVGLAVCYDIRFPGLFAALRDQGAQVVVLPSAFTIPTGQAHWHTLIRARAIENQIYMVAAAQSGQNHQQRMSYGHSMIVDPWGDIVSELTAGQGLIISQFDQAKLLRIRGTMPLQQHNRFKNELIDEPNRRA